MRAVAFRDIYPGEEITISCTSHHLGNRTHYLDPVN
jgi:hypothetical protein